MTDLKTIILSPAKKEIAKIANGTATSVTLEFCKPQHVLDLLQDNPNITFEKGGIDTNGWQWDYRINLIINGSPYILAGDGYYSDNCTLSKND
jgi:hypothetical protein